MNRRFVQVLGSLLFLLFAGGAIVLPAIHSAHCSDARTAHDETNCPICQLAGMPVIPSQSQSTPVIRPLVLVGAVFHDPIIPSTSLCGPSQARAPPAC